MQQQRPSRAKNRKKKKICPKKPGPSQLQPLGPQLEPSWPPHQTPLRQLSPRSPGLGGQECSLLPALCGLTLQWRPHQHCPNSPLTSHPPRWAWRGPGRGGGLGSPSPIWASVAWQHHPLGQHGWQGPQRFFFWPHYAACRVLVSQPGIGPGPLAVKALSPNLWTTGWGGGVLMSSSSPELAHTGQTVGGTSQGMAQSPGI